MFVCPGDVGTVYFRDPRSVQQHIMHDVYFFNIQHIEVENENFWILNEISLNNVPCGLIDNVASLV